MHWASADFSGSFRLKGKSRKMFHVIVSKKICVYKVFICGAAAR